MIGRIWYKDSVQILECARMKLLGISVLLVGLLILWMLTHQQEIEGFGLFDGSGGGGGGLFGMGTGAISYDTLVRDTYTANELVAWKANWLSMSVDERNSQLGNWDALEPKEQNKIYTQAVQQKKEREAVENTIASVPPPPLPPNCTAAASAAAV
jgi:hypothetical protein